MNNLKTITEYAASDDTLVDLYETLSPSLLNGRYTQNINNFRYTPAALNTLLYTNRARLIFLPIVHQLYAEKQQKLNIKLAEIHIRGQNPTPRQITNVNMPNFDRRMLTTNNFNFEHTISPTLPTTNLTTINLFYISESILSTFNYISNTYTTDSKIQLYLKEDRDHRILAVKVINPDTKAASLTIYTNRISNTLIAKVISNLPFWLNNIADLSRNEDLIELYNLLQGEDTPNIEDIFKTKFIAYIEKYQLKDNILIAQIQDTVLTLNENRINAIQNKISSQTNLIADYEYKHAQAYTVLKDLKLQETALINTPALTLDEFTQFLKHPGFKMNRLIKNYGSYNYTLIALTITAPLNDYDIDAAETLIKSSVGIVKNINEHVNEHIPSKYKNIFRTFMEKIFVTNEYKLIGSTELLLYLDPANRGNLSKLVTNYQGIIANHSQDLQNPHIYNYNCFGNNVTTLNKLILDNRFIMLADTLYNVVRNLNMNDATVMRYLFYNIAASIMHSLNKEKIISESAFNYYCGGLDCRNVYQNKCIKFNNELYTFREITALLLKEYNKEPETKNETNQNPREL